MCTLGLVLTPWPPRLQHSTDSQYVPLPYLSITSLTPSASLSLSLPRPSLNDSSPDSKQHTYFGIHWAFFPQVPQLYSASLKKKKLHWFCFWLRSLCSCTFTIWSHKSRRKQENIAEQVSHWGDASQWNEKLLNVILPFKDQFSNLRGKCKTHLVHMLEILAVRMVQDGDYLLVTYCHL